MDYPKLESNIGKKGKRKNPEGIITWFTIVDEIRHIQSNAPHKTFVLQKIKYKIHGEELRFGYYIIGKKGRMKGKWTWGQFAPLIPTDDFITIVREARDKGWA